MILPLYIVCTHLEDSALVSRLGTTTVLKYSLPPPLAHELMETASSYGLPRALHTRPFYSNPSDVQPAKWVSVCVCVCVCVGGWVGVGV